MAMKMLRVCDLCDRPATGDTVRFGWASSFYEADLCEQHAEEFATMLEKVVSSARRMGGDLPASVSFSDADPARKPRVATADVRDWAQKQGYPVNDKGRVPESLIERYLQSQVGSL